MQLSKEDTTFISRQAAIEALGEEPEVWTDSEGELATRFQWRIDKNIIETVPAADVVEVVRCKDCKHKEREQPGMVYCPMMVGSWVADDHFCKCGERRE